MITFKFKLKQKTITATVPENWSEVTVKHITEMEEKWSGKRSDLVGLLSAFTGQKYEDLEQSTTNLWEPLFQVLSFVFDPPKWDKLKRPKQVTLNGKYIKPPKKLELEAFGAKVQALNVITSDMPKVNKIPELLAIYLQPAYDGKFIGDRVEEIKPWVYQMKAYEALPYGIFFLKRLSGSKRFGRIGLRASRRTRKHLVSIQRQAASILTSLQTSSP